MYKNHEGYPDPTQGDAINGVRKEEIQRMREQKYNLKRGETIRIRENIDTPDGKRVKTTEMAVKELYAHCVLLEDKNGFHRCPDYWKLKRLRV